MTEPLCGGSHSEVLIVDDTTADLELLSGLLRERGCAVRAAVNGQLALQAARNSPPDLILLDIRMPGLNGFQVCAELKSDDAMKDIPVIFLSALGETIDKVQAFYSGGADYITKPFQIEEVEARVATQLELRRRSRRLQEAFDRLKESEQRHEALAHLLAHDLRSALRVLGERLEAVRSDRLNVLSPVSAENMTAAVKAFEKMAELVRAVPPAPGVPTEGL